MHDERLFESLNATILDFQVKSSSEICLSRKIGKLAL